MNGTKNVKNTYKGLREQLDKKQWKPVIYVVLGFVSISQVIG